ncbi:MAG: thiocyanate hydrolase [Solirubrobacteraceae bacterium]
MAQASAGEERSGTSGVRVGTLERIVERDQVWSRMARKHGVANPVPPWKSSLDGMCDALDGSGATLPLAARREDEDRLSQTLYADLPFPERQLVALAHSLVARGVIDEESLAHRMTAVRARLETS